MYKFVQSVDACIRMCEGEGSVNTTIAYAYPCARVCLRQPRNLVGGDGGLLHGRSSSRIARVNPINLSIYLNAVSAGCVWGSSRPRASTWVRFLTSVTQTYEELRMQHSYSQITKEKNQLPALQPTQMIAASCRTLLHLCVAVVVVVVVADLRSLTCRGIDEVIKKCIYNILHTFGSTKTRFYDRYYYFGENRLKLYRKINLS